MPMRDKQRPQENIPDRSKHEACSKFNENFGITKTICATFTLQYIFNFMRLRFSVHIVYTNNY